MTTTNSRLNSVLAALAAFGAAPAQGAAAGQGALAQLQGWQRQNQGWAADPSAGLFSPSGAPVYWQPLAYRAPPSQAAAAPAPEPSPAAPAPSPAPAPSTPGPARGESFTPAPTPAPPPNPLQTPTTPLTPGGSVSLNPPAPAPVTSLAHPSPVGTNGASSGYVPSLIPPTAPPDDPYALDPTGVRLGTGGDSTFGTGLTNTQAAQAGALAGGLGAPVTGPVAGAANALANLLGSMGSGQVPESQFPRAPASLPERAPPPDNSLPTTPGGSTSLAPPPPPAESIGALTGSLNAPRETTLNAPPAPPPPPAAPSVIRYPNGVTYDPVTLTATFPPGTSPYGYNANSESRTTSAADAARAGGVRSSSQTSTSSSSDQPYYGLDGSNARLGSSNAPGAVSLAPAPAPSDSPYSLGSASFSTGYAGGGSVADDEDPGDPFSILLDTYHSAYPQGFDLRTMQSPDAFGYRQALLKALMAGDYQAVEKIRQMAALYEDMFAGNGAPQQQEEQ